MTINNSDVQWYVAREAAGAVTGNLFPVPYVPGSRFDFTADQTSSGVLMPNRAAGPSRRTGYKVTGGLDMPLISCPAFEAMLESLLGGSFTANVLKAGTTQHTLYFEERYVNGTATNMNSYSGNDITDLTLDAKFAGTVDAKFQAVGLNSAHALTPSATTVTALTSLTPIYGSDVTNVTIGAMTNVYYSELSLSITAKKDTQGALGTAFGVGTAQDGAKTVKLTATMYRSDFNPETVIGDLPLAISIDYLFAGVGYRIQLPAARGSIPTNTTDAGSRMVQVDFMAEYDTTANTDVVITKLPLL
jgi:hypothetical protein